VEHLIPTSNALSEEAVWRTCDTQHFARPLATDSEKPMHTIYFDIVHPFWCLRHPMGDSCAQILFTIGRNE